MTALATHAQLHFVKSFFLGNALVYVNCNYSPIFLYTTKPDWRVHVMLNQKTILEWSIVNGSFFLNLMS